MNKRGPIVVVEDDADDQQILADIFEELNCSNEVVFFSDGKSAFEYFKREDVYPFIILSDINMPGIDGFELRNKVLTDVHVVNKCVPYLFMSTAVNATVVKRAYTMSVQGFFMKPSVYSELLQTVRVILDYWQVGYSPEVAGN